MAETTTDGTNAVLLRPPRYRAVGSWAGITWRLHSVESCDWCGRRPSGHWTPAGTALRLCDDCDEAWGHSQDTDRTEGR